eukprot:scaffold3951_cov258-Pinguiococcus_pyrenoidosus.AAC.7
MRSGYSAQCSLRPLGAWHLSLFWPTPTLRKRRGALLTQCTSASFCAVRPFASCLVQPFAKCGTRSALDECFAPRQRRGGRVDTFFVAECCGPTSSGRAPASSACGTLQQSANLSEPSRPPASCPQRVAAYESCARRSSCAPALPQCVSGPASAGARRRRLLSASRARILTRISIGPVASFS